jgi:hypothetical protein
MSGALAPGDLVVTTAQSSYLAGDAIVYRVGSGAGRGLLVVHRIIRADPAGYTMQGDANSYEDPWRPRAADVVGRLVTTLPGVGRYLAALANPFVLAALWGLAALVVGLSFLPDAPGRESDDRSKPAIRRRRRLGFIHAADPSAALFVGLFILPTPDPYVPHNSRKTRPAIRTRARRPMLKLATGWAVAVMVGLVMVSAGATLSPAHASRLTAHSAVLSAQVNKCPPASTGMCP